MLLRTGPIKIKLHIPVKPGVGIQLSFEGERLCCLCLVDEYYTRVLTDLDYVLALNPLMRERGISISSVVTFLAGSIPSVCLERRDLWIWGAS